MTSDGDALDTMHGGGGTDNCDNSDGETTISC